MKALILGDKIVQLSEETFSVAFPLIWVDVPPDTTMDDKWDGAQVVKFETPLPGPDELITNLSAVVQAHIDQVARSRAYTDGLHAATYANSTIPAWQAEGQAFVAWRDSVWIAAISIMDDCKAGLREIPTPDSLVSELPVMVWPDVDNG